MTRRKRRPVETSATNQQCASGRVLVYVAVTAFFGNRPAAPPSPQRVHSGSLWLQGQEFVEAAVGPGGQFLQRGFEPAVGLDAVELRGGKQGLDGRSALAGTLGAGDEPVFLAQRSGATRCLRSR